MGRKLQSKQTAKKRNSKEGNKFIQQKRKELSILVDKLLKLTSTFQATGTINKNWEHHLQIEALIKDITNIEAPLVKEERNQRKLNIEKYVSWLHEHGAEFEGVEISEFEGYELGLKATKEFKENTLVLTVPCKLMMSEKNAKESDLADYINSDTLLKNMSNITLALFLLYEKSKPESFWKPYIDFLPEKYSTILYYTLDELAELRPSPTFESSLKLYRSIARQYAYFYNKIHTKDVPVIKNLQEIFTFENYRLNNTYHMIERLLKIKDSICIYASKHSISQITSEEWLCLNKLVAILTPVEEITRKLSDTKTCISSVIPLIYVLKDILQVEKEKSDTNQNFRGIIQTLIEDINFRFSDVPDNILYLLATYLDPRYKLKFFNDIIKEQIQAEIIRLLTLYDLNVESSTSSQILPPTQSVYSNLADMLKNSSDNEEETGKDSTVTNSKLTLWKSLLNEYDQENRLELDDDPLLWWRYNTKYKDFAPIVRTYLSAPSSSVPGEQSVSAAGSTNELIRNRLPNDKLEKLLFVKYNLPLLNFDY